MLAGQHNISHLLTYSYQGRRNTSTFILPINYYLLTLIPYSCQGRDTFTLILPSPHHLISLLTYSHRVRDTFTFILLGHQNVLPLVTYNYFHSLWSLLPTISTFIKLRTLLVSFLLVISGWGDQGDDYLDYAGVGPELGKS